MAAVQSQGKRIPFARGFTLLELVLVLVLLGLVYGLAGQRFGEGSTGTQMRAATSQLAAGLRKARSMAITRRQDTVLTLDLEARTFSVTGDSKVYALPQPFSYKLFTAQSEVVAGRAGNIRFFPDGSSTGGRISIIAAEGNSKSVGVDWLTGRATVL